MKSVIVRDYDGYRMMSREMIKEAITPWSKRVTKTANQLIHFARSAINRAAMSNDASMCVIKSAIRYYTSRLMELL